METAEKTEARWLTYKQVQDEYNLSRTTAWRLLRTGKLRGAKIGRAMRVERRSLDEYMQEQTAD